MEEIIQFDKQLLLMVNGSDSSFLDYIILTLTNGLTWIPLYLGLLYVVLKSNKNAREVLLILAAAGLCYLLAGGIDDGIVKPLVARWRPTHDPEIGSMVDVVNNYRGGKYGFFSAHAANTTATPVCIWVSTILATSLSDSSGAVSSAGWSTSSIVVSRHLQDMTSNTVMSPSESWDSSS